MSVNPALCVDIGANGESYYRITSTSFGAKKSLYAKAVDGEGARLSKNGSRYAWPGATTVYLADSVETCLSEGMYYFVRDTITKLDLWLCLGVYQPSFFVDKILWEIEFKKPISDVFELDDSTAGSASINSAMMYCPTTDYFSLRRGRAEIQSMGYRGLRAPSARNITGGEMVVLFDDQSRNVSNITPHHLRFHLKEHGVSVEFTNPTNQKIDFNAALYQFQNNAPASYSASHGWSDLLFIP